MNDLNMFLEWLKTKDSTFLDTNDVPNVIGWIEELVELRKCVRSSAFMDGMRKGRADAIDEVIARIKEITSKDIVIIEKCNLDDIAEQLKEQN